MGSERDILIGDCIFIKKKMVVVRENARLKLSAKERSEKLQDILIEYLTFYLRRFDVWIGSRDQNYYFNDSKLPKDKS